MSEQDPGLSLREAREAAGLSQKDVADSLNLLVSNVEAIEANNFRHMNADIFVRGYIRSYARFLNLEPQPLLDAAERQLRDKSPSADNEIQPKAMSPIKPQHKILAALVIAGVLWAIAVVVMAPDAEADAGQAAITEAPEA